jgi:hypothetical protein
MPLDTSRREAYAQIQDDEYLAAGNPPYSTWVGRTIFLHSLKDVVLCLIDSDDRCWGFDGEKLALHLTTIDFLTLDREFFKLGSAHCLKPSP